MMVQTVIASFNLIRMALDQSWKRVAVKENALKIRKWLRKPDCFLSGSHTPGYGAQQKTVDSVTGSKPTSVSSSLHSYELNHLSKHCFPTIESSLKYSNYLIDLLWIKFNYICKTVGTLLETW